MDHEEFESLKPEEQEQVFHQSSFREKGDLILHSHYPERLAQSLSQEELYLVTREMDLEERSEIVRYANLQQLVFISDIDCWKKDRIQPQGFLRWLETLKEADETRLLAWLVEMDYEAVVSGFKQLVRVIKPEWEYPTDEMLGDQPFFTLDERYFISVPEENLETVRRAIEILFEHHRGRYAAILEGILGEMDDVLEEDAFRKREERFADLGFPDPETAHKIYKPISMEEFEKFPKKANESFRKNGENRFPHYPVLWSQDRLFLDQVLLFFKQENHEIAEGIEEELAWLSNKVLACEGIDFSSEERVRRGTERVRRFLNIGLEALSAQDISKAREILRERWLEIIFRFGVTKLLEVKNLAAGTLQIHWKGSAKEFTDLLAVPYEPQFRGVLKVVPEAYDPHALEHPNPLRDFKTLEEIEKTKQAVLQIQAALEWLNHEWPGFPVSIPLFATLGTVFTSFTLWGKIMPRALQIKDVGSFLDKAFEKRGARRFLTSLAKEKFLNHFFTQENQELLRSLWGIVFQELEDEIGRLDLSKAIDARFIASLWVVDEVHKKTRRQA